MRETQLFDGMMKRMKSKKKKKVVKQCRKGGKEYERGKVANKGDDQSEHNWHSNRFQKKRFKTRGLSCGDRKKQGKLKR
jgi:hypothetical protein